MNDVHPTAPTSTAASTTTPQRARLVRPPTSARAKREAAARAAQLARVLAVRGDAFDRTKLSPQELLTKRRYDRAAAAYLAGHDDFFHKQALRLQARHVPLDDLVQAARLGGLRALDRFDATLLHVGIVTSFLSFARWWVRYEVGRVLEDEALVRISPTTRKHAADLGEEIAAACLAVGVDADTLDDEAVVALLNRNRARPVTVDHVRAHRRVYLGHDHVRLLWEVGEDEERDDSGVVAAVGVAEQDREAAASAKTSIEAMMSAMPRLPALHRRVLAEEFGLSCEEVGVSDAPLHISAVARAAVVKSGLARLREAMASAEQRR